MSKKNFKITGEEHVVLKVKIIDEIKFWRDYKFWLPLFISVFTLISTIIISSNFISPFNPKFYNSIHLWPQSHIDNNHRPEGLFLIISSTFLNANKKPGTINNLYINVVHKNDNYRDLAQVMEIETQSIIKDCKSPTVIRGGFKPFVLGGEDHLQKDFIFALGNIDEGAYEIGFYIEYGNGLRRAATSSINISSKMKDEYLMGNMLFDVKNETYGLIECRK